MPLLDARFRSQFLVLFAMFVFYGTSMTLIGATLPRILADFHWTYLAAGSVLAAGALAYFLSTFLAGFLLKSLGAKICLLLGMACSALALVFFAMRSDPLSNFLLGFLLGLGQGLLEVAVNWSVLRLDSHASGRPMNLIHGAFAVGAIVGPVVLGALMHFDIAWVLIFRILALGFGLMGVIVLFMRFQLPNVLEEKSNAGGGESLLRQPAYWLTFWVLFLYVGVEMGISNWVAEYFVAVFHISVSSSALLVSLFWAGVLAGRFGVPLLYRGERQGLLLAGFSSLALLATLLLSALGLMASFPQGLALAVLLVFMAGLGCSIIYPAVMTLAGNAFPLAQGQVVGFAATGGGVGAFLFPFLMSAMAQRWGIVWGFASYAFFAILMTGATILLIMAVQSRQALCRQLELTDR